MPLRHMLKHNQAQRHNHDPKHRHSHIPDTGRSLDEYWDALPNKTCVCCGAGLLKCHMKSDEGQYGWMIRGMKNPQWIYVHCPYCNYDSSITKLGIPQEVF